MKKGNCVDEKIILFQRSGRWRREDYDLLNDEIPICGRRVRFQRFSLFDRKFRILLPEDFGQMPEQIARVKYISIYRPPVILTSPNYDENFGFHLLEDEETELDGLFRQMQRAVLLQAPETVIYDKGIIAASGMEGRWFEYKNFTIDEETYNMQFLISTDVRRTDNCQSGSSFLAGTFNCRMIHYDQWNPLVLKILTLIEKEGEEKK